MDTSSLFSQSRDQKLVQNHSSNSSDQDTRNSISPDLSKAATLTAPKLTTKTPTLFSDRSCCTDNSLSISQLSHTGSYANDSLADIHLNSHLPSVVSSTAYTGISNASSVAEDDLFGISPEVENYFTHNFRCCGMHLKDMHESLLHYELHHVRDERNAADTMAPNSNAAQLAVQEQNRQKKLELFRHLQNHADQNLHQTYQVRKPGPQTSNPNLNCSNSTVDDSEGRRRHRLFLDVESNDNSNSDPYNLAAFDDTVIRTRNPYLHNSLMNPTQNQKFKEHQNLQKTSSKYSIYTTQDDHSCLRNQTNTQNASSIISQSERSINQQLLETEQNPIPIKSNGGGIKTMELDFYQDEDEEDLEFEIEEDTVYSCNQTNRVPSGNTSAYHPNTIGMYRSINDSYFNNSEEAPKPHVCPYPGCTKSYKNPNGLKYHTIHGHKSSNSDAEKPYECTFLGCNKRFKNPNGLKYHLDHSH